MDVARSDLRHFARLEHAQELRLHRVGQLTHFVEEHDTAVRALEQSRARVNRAGKRAACVAEELTFEQRFDDGGAVHGEERTITPAAQMVQRARNQFLASTRSHP